MAASTGPDINTYDIPDVELGDTFNVWRDITNTQTYKLNKLEVYRGISSDSIDVTVSSAGVLTADIATNVNKGVTFQQPVTFNGDVTFNATTFTVNANAVTIDDYSIVLGNTAAGSTDSKITAAGGGGLLIDRSSSGDTAEWLWKPTQVHGVTGVWQANSHIGFSGATSGLYPTGGKTLPVHGTGIRLDGGSTTDHGLQIGLTDTYGSTSDRGIEFSRYSPSGSTAFIEVLSGTTYGTRPFVSIRDGANRKVITQTSHSLQFGMPVRFDGTNYVKAQATDGSNAEVMGIVSKYIDVNTFELTFIGEIFGDFTTVNSGSALNPGSTYYLSPYVSGGITPVQPSAAGVVHKAVLIATSATSAVVIPFTGGVLSSPLNIVNASSVATRIVQANTFAVGDIVRFKSYPTGVTLNYKWGAGAGDSYEQYNAYGIYVKAQANSEEEAEVAGMVIGIPGTTGNVGYKSNTGFDVLMDGFFDLSAVGSMSFSPGTVYFLNKNCAGTTGSFESPTASWSTSYPTEIGMVRKPMFMATSPKAGYLFSYRGDIRSEVGLTGASADITRLLVSDPRDGISGDLVIGVYNGSSNGRETIRLSAGTDKFTSTRGSTGGLVGIGSGWSQYAVSSGSSENRIMAQLDVNGVLRLGRTLASTPAGQDLIVVRDVGDAVSGTTMSSRVVIGTDYSNGNLVIGKGVRPNPSSAGYISSLAGGQDRGALIIGASGADGPALRWRTAANSSAALGTSVTMTDVFSIVGATATFAGALNIGATTDRTTSLTHPARLFIQGDSNTTSRPQVYMNTTDGNFLLMNAGGANADYNPINGDSGSYLVFGKSSGAGAGRTFAIAPWATQNCGLLMSYNGTSVNVGINRSNPATALDVTGTIRASANVVIGGATFAAPTGTAPLFGARAWVVFETNKNAAGTAENPLTATGRFIQASGNVSSVTRDSAGVYKITFAQPMPDTNYIIIANSATNFNNLTNIAQTPSGVAGTAAGFSDPINPLQPYNKTTTSCYIVVGSSLNGNKNDSYSSPVSAIIFR